MDTVPDGPPERSRSLFFGFDPKAAKNPPATFGRVGGAQTFPPLSGSDNQRGKVKKKKIDITAIPKLGTSVGMHGSIKQKEVMGPICLAIVVGIVIGI